MRAPRPRSQTSLAATCVGTPYYLSPELVTGQGYDDRADLWSLGVVAYELLALRRPFTGENIGQLAMRITTGRPKKLPAATPQDLQEVVRLLLLKETGRPAGATSAPERPRAPQRALQPRRGSSWPQQLGPGRLTDGGSSRWH